MREVFQEHLRPLGEEVYQVRGCWIPHVRYRKAGHCRVQYELHLAELGTGHEWSQWVTGVMLAGGRTRRMWNKLRRSEPEWEISGAPVAFAPFSYIPQLDMLVQVFPYDRRLEALPSLVAGPPPELKPLLLARFGPGKWQVEAWEAEPVRYRAETRATLRLTVRARDAASGQAGERRFYAKVYSKAEKGEQTYQVLRALWNKASAGVERFTVGRPIAYLDGLRILIQEETIGTTLEEVLFQEEDALPAVRKTARALATLHLEDLITPQRNLLQNEIAAVERWGKFLQQDCPHLRPRIEEIAGALVTGLKEGVSPAPIHGDFKTDHVLVDGERLVLLDLDEFTEADPIQDTARILAHLTSMPIRGVFPHDRAWSYAHAFVEEYFARVPEAWRDRLPLRYAGAVFRMASDNLQRPQPDWLAKVEALVEEAEDSLAGRVW